MAAPATSVAVLTAVLCTAIAARADDVPHPEQGPTNGPQPAEEQRVPPTATQQPATPNTAQQAEPPAPEAEPPTTTHPIEAATAEQTRASSAKPPDEFHPHWTLGGGLGLALPDGDKYLSADLEMGGFVQPHLVVGGRITSVIFSRGVLGVAGPQLQFWPIDKLFVGVSGGFAFGVADQSKIIGPAIGLRTGVALSKSDLTPTISAEVTVIQFPSNGDGGGGSFGYVSVMLGLQTRRASSGSDPLEARHGLGRVVITGGALVDLAALVVGDSALHHRDNARFECNNDLSGCTRSALPEAQKAFRYSVASSALFVSGTASIAAGIYLLATSGHAPATTVVPSVGPSSAGAVVSRSF
jgi:hypothetical protein